MPGQATVTIRDKQWQVSIASTLGELVQGLGGIPKMPPGTGMLFDMGFEQSVTVTTEPMLFPLDIAFFSEDMVVTEIYRNIEPGYMVTSILPARYFLEVNAGELDGIDTGDRASVEIISLAITLALPDWVSALLSLLGFAVAGMLTVSLATTVIEDIEGQPSRLAFLTLPKTASRGFFIGQSGGGALK